MAHDQTEAAPPGADSPASAAFPNQCKEGVPYCMLRLVPTPLAGGLWDRGRNCTAMHASNYTCVRFHKPISRPFSAW